MFLKSPNSMAFFSLLLLLAGLVNAAAVERESNFKIKKGFFVNSDVGLFASLGGYRDPLVANLASSSVVRERRTFSNLGPYVGITLGYDILNNLALGLKLGQGYVVGAARSPSRLDSPTSYSLSFVDVALMSSIEVHRRILLAGQIFSGIVVMTPKAGPGVNRLGVDIGIGLGFKFYTLLSGLFVGIDLNARMSLLSETQIGIVPGIVTFAVTPTIGYVF